MPRTKRHAVLDVQPDSRVVRARGPADEDLDDAILDNTLLYLNSHAFDPLGEPAGFGPGLTGRPPAALHGFENEDSSADDEGAGDGDKDEEVVYEGEEGYLYEDDAATAAGLWDMETGAMGMDMDVDMDLMAMAADDHLDDEEDEEEEEQEYSMALAMAEAALQVGASDAPLPEAAVAALMGTRLGGLGGGPALAAAHAPGASLLPRAFGPPTALQIPPGLVPASAKGLLQAVGNGAAGSSGSGPRPAATAQQPAGAANNSTPVSAAAAARQCMEANCLRMRQHAADRGYEYCRRHMVARGILPAKPVCSAPGCDRYARLSVQEGAARRFCTAHMVREGLQPRPMGPRCTHAGCTRLAQRAVGQSATREYCAQHMGEHGQAPLVPVCSHEGCFQTASCSAAGEFRYCPKHMREHGQQPQATFVACEEEGCRRQSRLSTSGVRKYCLLHMANHGLEPLASVEPCSMDGCARQAVRAADGSLDLCREHLRAAGKQPAGLMACCRHEGCAKVAQYSQEGLRMYCVPHMREHGQQPRRGRVCQQPGCSALARLATGGTFTYCRTHLVEHGLVEVDTRKFCVEAECTRVAKCAVQGALYCKRHARARGATLARQQRRPRVCEHDGCESVKAARAAGNSGWYCRAHMAEHNLAPDAPTTTERRHCAMPGCTKFSKPSTSGSRMYCKAHMKAHGLTPATTIKYCREEGCSHQAKPDLEGKWLYCKGHMRQHGMWPRDSREGRTHAAVVAAAKGQAAVAAAAQDGTPGQGQGGVKAEQASKPIGPVPPPALPLASIPGIACATPLDTLPLSTLVSGRPLATVLAARSPPAPPPVATPVIRPGLVMGRPAPPPSVAWQPPAVGVAVQPKRTSSTASDEDLADAFLAETSPSQPPAQAADKPPSPPPAPAPAAPPAAPLPPVLALSLLQAMRTASPAPPLVHHDGAVGPAARLPVVPPMPPQVLLQARMLTAQLAAAAAAGGGDGKPVAPAVPPQLLGALLGLTASLPAAPLIPMPLRMPAPHPATSSTDAHSIALVQGTGTTADVAHACRDAGAGSVGGQVMQEAGLAPHHSSSSTSSGSSGQRAHPTPLQQVAEGTAA